MPIKVTNDMTAALERMVARVELAAPAGAEAMGFVVEASIKRQIQGGHPKGTKTGATPGGPPQNVTGTLRRSVITGHPHWLGVGRAAAEVGPTTKYARAVELGHPRWKNGVRYPSVEPGVRQAEHTGQLHAIATGVIATAIRG